MNTTLFDVPIIAEGEVMGKRWRKMGAPSAKLNERGKENAATA
jgi:hypothetical protein